MSNGLLLAACHHCQWLPMLAHGAIRIASWNLTSHRVAATIMYFNKRRPHHIHHTHGA